MEVEESQLSARTLVILMDWPSIMVLIQVMQLRAFIGRMECCKRLSRSF